MQVVGVLLHTVYLDSELVTGLVVVGASDEFPVRGVSFILGNDLASGKVLLNPEVTAVPRSECPDDSVERFTGVFSICDITRAMAEKQCQSLSGSGDGEVEYGDSFMADGDSSVRPAFSPPGPSSPRPPSPPSPVEESVSKLSMSYEQLIVEQQRDPTLISLCGGVGCGDDDGGGSPSYFLKEDVLMRKWTPLDIDPQDD